MGWAGTQQRKEGTNTMQPPKTAEQIRAAAEEEIRKAEGVNSIYALIPNSIPPLKVFVCATSYSADWLVKVSVERYSSLGNAGAKIDATTVRELAAAFPPIQLRRYEHHGSKTILPVARLESWPEKKRAEYPDWVEIAPFFVDIEPARFSNTATLAWYSRADVGIIHVEVEFALHSVSGWLGTSTVRYQQYQGGERVTENHFAPHSLTHRLSVDEMPVADRAQMVRYASGSPETPGQHLLYWQPLSPEPVSIEAIIAIIPARAEVTA
jgi:hypothetical protein